MFQNIFKAKAVPKHVNKPLFWTMVENQPKRFEVGRSRIVKMKRTQSVDNVFNSMNNDFKAKPFPSEIFTDFAYEKMKEDIAYRNVRKAIRQKELLASSNWPPRMQLMFSTAKESAPAGGTKKLTRGKKVSDNNEKVSCPTIMQCVRTVWFGRRKLWLYKTVSWRVSV